MYKNIFDKTILGRIPMKNRLIRSATWENLADSSGIFEESLIPLYAELAQGGIGLIITGFTSVSSFNDDFGGMMRLSSDELIPQFQKLVKTVKSYNCPIISQLALGSYRKKNQKGILQRVEITDMKDEDIAEVIKLFSDAALRAQKAGFDGVQIHVAHGFFLSRCISPLYNMRQDQYGGSTIKRARILTDIIDAIKTKTEKFHVSMKINCEDFQYGGLTSTDSQIICKLAESHEIDSIEVSDNSTSRSGIKAKINEGYFLSYAENLQKMIDVPVISVGGYRSIYYINKALNETSVEYFSLSRPLIKEPNLPNRWKERNTKPSSCISCNSCYKTQGHGCIFN